MMPATPESVLGSLLSRMGAEEPFHSLVLRSEPGYVALVFQGRSTLPSYVFKASSQEGAREALRKEHEALMRLHERGSESLRKTIPRPLAHDEVAGLRALLVSACAGVRLKDLPVRRAFGPTTISRTLTTVTDWLVEYYQAAGTASGMTAEWKTRLFDEPVARYRRLFRTLPQETQTLSRALENLAGSVASSIPVCAAHGDLSPANVLWDDGRIAVIDYEFAFESVPPLDDLFHFLGSLRSSTSAVGRLESRRRFFEEVFYGTGYVSRAALQSVVAFAGRLGIPLDLIEDLFVMSWVRLAVRNVDLQVQALGLEDEARDPERLWERLDAQTEEFLPVLRMQGGVCDNVRQYLALRDRCIFRRGAISTTS